MLVSVVIPCHNSLRYLPETLDAVLAQCLPGGVEQEVILVDDGGTDDLAAWERERGDPRVRVVRQENTGVAGARNRGIAESSGELIAFCDSDDVWTPEHTAELVTCFRRDPGIGLAYGWYDTIDAQGSPTGATRKGSMSGWVWDRLVLDNPIGASAVIVSRAALDDVGVFSVNRDLFRIDVEDWELWLRIAKRWRVALTPNVVCHYRRHDSNSSGDIESLDAAYAHLFATVFDEGEEGDEGRGDGDAAPGGRSVDTERLRARAEANTSLILAWQSLNDREDPKAALAYLRRAVDGDPSMRKVGEYWRVRLAAETLSRSGRHGYAAIRGANTTVRRGKSLVGRIRRR